MIQGGGPTRLARQYERPSYCDSDRILPPSAEALIRRQGRLTRCFQTEPPEHKIQAWTSTPSRDIESAASL